MMRDGGSIDDAPLIDAVVTYCSLDAVIPREEKTFTDDTRVGYITREISRHYSRAIAHKAPLPPKRAMPCIASPRGHIR